MLFKDIDICQRWFRAEALCPSSKVPITFLPHLTPMTRGILSSCYAKVLEGKVEGGEAGREFIAELYRSFYRNEPFVRVVDDPPQTKHTQGTNLCFVYPTIDPKTRTLRARLRFDNRDGTLKPDMYADVRIYAGPKPDVLSIPREALIRTGHSERVVVALGDGKFSARAVVSGMESGDWVEIVSGLAEGDRVVISGQFLIDSESNLKAALAGMAEDSSEGQEAMPGGHQH